MTSHIAARVIKSLHQKKYRQQTGKFLVEGEKNVVELINSDFEVDAVYATDLFIQKYKGLGVERRIKIQQADAGELKALGTLEQNHSALAVAFQKRQEEPEIATGISLALDDISDPGNFGTLVRIADWYGIKNIFCSSTCVDFYSPKVIGATMGSFTRVSVFRTDLPEFLQKQKVPIIGAFLKGDSIHSFEFPKSGILVIGSESHGISKEVEKLTGHKITIPRYSEAESLNAAVAGGIILDRWKAQ